MRISDWSADVCSSDLLIQDPGSLGWLLVGAAMGIGYGVWGLRLTRFETVREGYFFTPHPRLGMIIAMLFVASLLFVGFEIYVNKSRSAERRVGKEGGRSWRARWGPYV